MARRATVALLTVGVAMVTLASSAQAHVAIILLIERPQAGATVGPDTLLVVSAQRALAGIDRTAFTVAVDGEPIDPATGRPAATPVSLEIEVSTTHTIALHHLQAGHHQITVSYRADVDQPITTRTVDIVVRPSRSRHHAGVITVVVAVIGGLAGVGAVLALVVTRHGRLREESPGQGRSG